MKLLSSYPYHLALLLSFAYISADNLEHVVPLTNQSVEQQNTTPTHRSSGIPQNTYSFEDAAPASEKNNETQEQQPQERTIADHLKHALTAGLIHACQIHEVDELDAHVYSPENGSTFSSAVSNNTDGLVDRMKRMLGVEPTISISSGAVFTPEETHPKIRFKHAMLKFAENADLPCKQRVDSNGNKTVVCTIVMTLKEFYALKEEYKNSNQ
jgi:hypothetical protein